MLVFLTNKQTKMLHKYVIEKDCFGNIVMPQGDNNVQVDLR